MEPGHQVVNGGQPSLSSHSHGNGDIIVALSIGIETIDITVVMERVGLETGDQAAAFATFVVSEMEREFPNRAVGRSLLQKLLFLLAKDDEVIALFDLFINGPYSDWVEDALGKAVDLGMLTVLMENGRSSISARGGIMEDIPPESKERALQCVRAFGFYEESDLAILTTAIFLEQNGIQGIDDMVKAVSNVNPRFDLRRICSLLDLSDIVYRSW